MGMRSGEDRLFRVVVRNMLLALLLALLGVAAPLNAKPHKSGQVVVKVKKQTDIQQVIEQFEGTVLDSIYGRRTFLIGFLQTYTEEEILAQLEEDESVAYAHLNATLSLPETFQISQGFPDQKKVPLHIKGLEPASFYMQPGLYATGLEAAHDISTGEGISIAVIDNGIYAAHPAFEDSRIKFGHDFVDLDGDPSEEVGTLYGHGTFVCGLLVLAAPDCDLMPLRVFDENGLGDQYSAAQAIYWAVHHRADLVNMSFGAEFPDSVLTAAVEDALAAGLVLVAATGNEASHEPTYPAGFEGVIAVTSLDMLERLADFANHGDYLDLCAPGVDLYSALPGDAGWGTWSGTSFSAPLVSGTAALILDRYGLLDGIMVRNALRQSARTSLLWGDVVPPDHEYGYGALDAYSALTEVVRGDVNGSGTHDEDDVRLMVALIAQPSDFDTQPDLAQNADLNGDGRVNMKDVTALVKLVVKELRK